MPTYHIQFTNGDNTEVVTDKPLLIDERTVRADADGVPFWCPIERVQFIKMTREGSRVDLSGRTQFTEAQRQEVADIIKRLHAKSPSLPNGI